PAPLNAIPVNPVELSTAQLTLSSETGMDGQQVVSMSGELDIASAQLAYTYLSDVIDHSWAPVSVDLGGVTVFDASGVGVPAPVAKHARAAGRQLKLTSVRLSLVRIMRIPGLDNMFPELRTPVLVR